MESDAEPRGGMMIEQDAPHNRLIDPERARFPCCIVWTPLPVVSWLLPFVGHVGIGREDGVILDFAGPNFVCVDNFTFGSVSRYIQISKEKCSITSNPSTTFRTEEEYSLVESGRNQYTWDDALRKSTQEYQHRAYNIFSCNCHSFVANNLNKLEFQSGGWNVVNLAVLILFKGKWVNTASMIRSFLPFVLVFVIGVTFGGETFLTFLALFAFLFVGWFLCGTYYFKSLIHV
ncbi:protein RTE1-HOMOLOG-like isoform X2 [Bidens hawaiensis]